MDEKSNSKRATLKAVQRVMDDGIQMIVVGVEVRQ